MNFNLIHGDCYEIIPTLEDCSINLVITDPPYKLGNTKGGGLYKLVNGEEEANNPYKRKATNSITELHSLSSTDFDARKFLELIKPKMKKFYGYFFCNKILVPDYLNFATENKYSFEILILHKQNPIPARNNHFLPDMEYCIMIRERGTYFSKTAEFDDYRKLYTVSCSGKRLHPAEKPVEFLERFVRVSCPKDGVILDAFMGSGSTAIAAIQNGRKFIGIEKNAEYFDIAEKRIKMHDDFLKGVGTLFENEWGGYINTEKTESIQEAKGFLPCV